MKHVATPVALLVAVATPVVAQISVAAEISIDGRGWHPFLWFAQDAHDIGKHDEAHDPVPIISRRT
jgi:hypothetical protein